MSDPDGRWKLTHSIAGVLYTRVMALVVFLDLGGFASNISLFSIMGIIVFLWN
jgi:hypothetical protein